MIDAQVVLKLLHSAKIPYSTESEMQGAIEHFLTEEQVPFEREFRFTNKDIVDFFIDGSIAVECKTKGQAMAIYRQVQRYAVYEVVKAVVLFTSIHMNLPPTINDKPAFVIKAGRAWL